MDSQLPQKWSILEHLQCPQRKENGSKPWLLARGTMEASTGISTEAKAEVKVEARVESLLLSSQGTTTSGTSSSSCLEEPPEEDQVRQLVQFVSTARRSGTSPRTVPSPRSRRPMPSESLLSHFILLIESQLSLSLLSFFGNCCALSIQ